MNVRSSKILHKLEVRRQLCFGRSPPLLYAIPVVVHILIHLVHQIIIAKRIINSYSLQTAPGISFSSLARCWPPVTAGCPGCSMWSNIGCGLERYLLGKLSRWLFHFGAMWRLSRRWRLQFHSCLLLRCASTIRIRSRCRQYPINSHWRQSRDRKWSRSAQASACPL